MRFVNVFNAQFLKYGTFCLEKVGNWLRLNNSTHFISLKNRVATTSAMEAHDVGCPEPAAEVDSTEWMRSLVAMSPRETTSSEVTGMMVMVDLAEGN